MADITMCLGTGCPLKDKCYRHTAKPNPFWQSYFMATPYKHGALCAQFWENEQNNKKVEKMKESTIEITFQVNDAGITESVSVQSDATARDRVLAAMYLLEDAFKTGREYATEDEQNPIATLIGDSFNAHCVLDSLSELSRKVEKNDEKNQ